MNNQRKKRTTSQDVADLTGVSRATVSAHLNKTRYVSPELSNKIEKAIKKLNYIPDPIARALKLHDLKTIGIITPVLSSFYTPMLNSINKIALANNYDFLLGSSEEDFQKERELVNLFISKRISGILIIPTSNKNKDFLNQIINNYMVPIVQVNRKIDGFMASSVVSNNNESIYKATKHLIVSGKRKIALLGCDLRSYAGDMKRKGYEKAINEYGYEEIIVYSKEHDKNDIYKIFNNLLDKNKNIDGLICTTQTKTKIALDLLKSRNIKIPDNISVIGYSADSWCKLVNPPLTVISENMYKMGEIATNLLLKMLEEGIDKSIQNVVIQNEFIIRKST